jgi:hypothetical protein
LVNTESRRAKKLRSDINATDSSLVLCLDAVESSEFTLNQVVNSMNSKITLLNLAKYVALRFADAHARAATNYGKRGFILTIVNICAGILILFFSANKEAESILLYVIKKLNTLLGSDIPASSNFVVGFFGAVNVITSSFQFLFRYEERYIRHGAAHAEFINLHRKIERLLSAGRTAEKTDSDIHKINRQMNNITKYSPGLADRHFNKKVFFGFKKKSRDESIETIIARLQKEFDAFFAKPQPEGKKSS